MEVMAPIRMPMVRLTQRGPIITQGLEVLAIWILGKEFVGLLDQDLKKPCSLMSVLNLEYLKT